MRRLVALFNLGTLVIVGTAWAQPPEGVAALRELLSGGYYALAAQVEGPQVVEANPESAEAHLLYARALFLVGNHEAASRQVARAKTHPTTPELSCDLTHLEALVRAAQGDTANAARLLGRVFRAAPDYRAAMDWAQVAWQGGDLETALHAYRAAADTPQGEAEPWPSLNTARLLLQQGRFSEALAPLETTLTILEQEVSALPSPAYAETFYRLGQAQEALGEVDEAVSNYQAAANADPDYAPAETALLRLNRP